MVDGVVPSPWHGHAAERLKDILKDAARQAGADVHVACGPNDVSTPAGVRKPDVFVVPREVARAAIGGIAGVEDYAGKEFVAELSGEMPQAAEVPGADRRRGLDLDSEDLAPPVFQEP